MLVPKSNLKIKNEGAAFEAKIIVVTFFDLLRRVVSQLSVVKTLGSVILLTFLKVATTLVDLLFVELVLHLSHVKKMYSQPINLTHELILHIQIKRERVHFNGDSTAKSPFWHRVLNL